MTACFLGDEGVYRRILGATDLGSRANELTSKYCLGLDKNRLQHYHAKEGASLTNLLSGNRGKNGKVF